MNIFNIIIPYYNLTSDQIKQLYNTLDSQSIIEYCNIILVSDNSISENEVKQIFASFKYNLIFDRNNDRLGPGVARNQGLKYLNESIYTLFLDADDYFNNEYSLESLYNELKASKNELLYFWCKSDENPDCKKLSCVVSNNYLIQSQIKFPPFFMGETQVFQVLLDDYFNNNVSLSENNYIIYGLKNNKNHLLKEISNYNEIIFNFCNALPYLVLLHTINNNTRIEEFIKRYLDFYYNSPVNKVFFYYSLHILYNKYPCQFESTFNNYKHNKLSIDLLDDLKNHNFFYQLEDQTLNSENSIKNYLRNFIKNWKSNIFMYPALKEMNNLLSLGENL